MPSAKGSKCKHHHLERHHHAEHTQIVHGLAHQRIDAGDVPRAHGTAQQDECHAGDGDERAVPETLQKALGRNGVDVVCRAGKGICRGRQERRRSTDGGLLFKGVQQYHEDWVHIQDRCYGEQHRPEQIEAFFCLDHYCCTSLERVALS